MITGESDYQCNLERKAADVSALLSENTDKYEFFTSEDVLPEKGKLKKPSAIIKKKMDIHHWKLSWKNKLALEENNIKDYTRYVNLIKKDVNESL